MGVGFPTFPLLGPKGSTICGDFQVLWCGNSTCWTPDRHTLDGAGYMEERARDCASALMPEVGGWEPTGGSI